MDTKNNKKILIIEDEQSMLEALSDKFIREGLKVLVAKDGKEGLKLALKEHPILILLDILMPKVDGLTVLRKLRKDNWGKNVIVIMLTNLTSSEKIAEAVKGKMNEYLVKSDWRIDEIVGKVKEKLAFSKIT